MKRLTVEITFFANGGRERLPLLTSGIYRPHLVVDGRTPNMADSLLGVKFVAGPESTAPSQPILATVELTYPGVDYAGLREGATFSIHEGIRVVGRGRVLGSVA